MQKSLTLGTYFCRHCIFLVVHWHHLSFLDHQLSSIAHTTSDCRHHVPFCCPVWPISYLYDLYILPKISILIFPVILIFDTSLIIIIHQINFHCITCIHMMDFHTIQQHWQQFYFQFTFIIP